MIRRLLVLLAAAGCLGGALGACSGSHSSAPSSSASASALNDNSGTGPYQGLGLTPAQPRPAFTLTTTAGQPFDFQKTTAGHPTLLYFGYTNCPDACPETMANVALALKAVPASLRDETYVVFVTTDVTHDTAPVITQWLRTFAVMATGGHYVGLRGTEAQINLAEASAKIPLATDGGQTHSTELLLFGADNYAHVVYALTDPVTQQQGQIAHDLPLVART